MGFRHLFGFNLVMLGKQGWKLLTEQDTIVTRIYKARYFPRTDFLGARLGHNPSFIWRFGVVSLLPKYWLEVANAGVSRTARVLTYVWKESWLRSTDNSYISSPLIQGMEQIKVADFFCTERKSWKWEDIEVV